MRCRSCLISSSDHFGNELGALEQEIVARSVYDVEVGVRYGFRHLLGQAAELAVQSARTERQWHRDLRQLLAIVRHFREAGHAQRVGQAGWVVTQPFAALSVECGWIEPGLRGPQGLRLPSIDEG